MEELKKIQSAIYNKHILNAFKKTPLTYSGSEVIINNLMTYKDKAIEKYQNEEFYESACIVKSLIEKSIEQLEHIDDDDGYIGKFLFELFDLFPQILQKLEYDKKELFKDIINLLYNEELGFSQELTYLLFNISNNDDMDMIEILLIKQVKQAKDKVKKEKVIYTLISFYQVTGHTLKFFESCQMLPKESWERYILISQKLEEQGRLEKARKVLEEGIKQSSHFYLLLKEKYQEFLIRNNINEEELAEKNQNDVHITKSSDSALFEEITYELKNPEDLAKSLENS